MKELYGEIEIQASAARWLDTDTRRGFEEMNQALKAWAEQGG